MLELPSGMGFSSHRATYQIVKQLGEGGRGVTYLARVMERKPTATGRIPAVGTGVVIKTAKIDEARGMSSITYFIDFVDRRLQEEARALTKLDGLACVAQYVDTGTFQVTLTNGEIVEPRFLVQQFVEGTVLANALVGNDVPDAFRGVRSAREWFDRSLAIAEIVIAVHQRGVVHNDIWQRNIMLTADGQPVLIDFGEAVFRTARNLAFIDQPERKDPWIAPEWNWTHIRPSRRADIFGVGGVLFWMACGGEPPMPQPDIEQAKVDIEVNLRERNARLLVENVAIADLIARCRRYDRDLRIPNAETLRRELQAFSQQKVKSSPIEAAQRLSQQATKVATEGRVFLARMADIVLRQTERVLEDMCRGTVEIGGTHEEVVSGCVDALASLQPGDEYLAVSALKFWKPDNIGVRGRFLSMTHLCAMRGIRIRRVFLLTEADQRDEHFWPIMQAQMELQSTYAERPESNLQTRFLVLPPKEFAQRVDHGDHCGFWISEGQVMDIAPVYDEKDRLRAIRLIISDVDPGFVRKSFEKDFDRGLPLSRDSLTNAFKA